MLQAKAVLDQVSMRRLMVYIAVNNEEVSTATTHIVQNVIRAVTDIDRIRQEREKYETERTKNPHSRMKAWAFLSDKLGKNCSCILVFIILGYLV